MSPLVLLGSLGTALSTVVMVPHLTTALRARRPAGTTFTWALSAVTSSVWLVYGFAVGDILMAAPGFVTVPIGVALAVWSHLATVSERMQVAALDELYAAPAALPLHDSRASDLGDTLEMPRIAA